MIPILLKEIGQTLNLGQYRCALALTLTLPDICGQIAYPELVDKRGKRLVKEQYVRWLDEFVFAKTKLPEDDAPIQLDGYACFKLRCAFLHSGSFDLGAQASKIRHFKLHFDNSTECSFSSLPSEANDFTMDVDICTLCKMIGLGALEYYNKQPNKQVFAISEIIDNTPAVEAVLKKITEPLRT